MKTKITKKEIEARIRASIDYLKYILDEEFNKKQWDYNNLFRKKFLLKYLTQKDFINEGVVVKGFKNGQIVFRLNTAEDIQVYIDRLTKIFKSRYAKFSEIRKNNRIDANKISNRNEAFKSGIENKNDEYHESYAIDGRELIKAIIDLKKTVNRLIEKVDGLDKGITILQLEPQDLIGKERMVELMKAAGHEDYLDKQS